MREAIGNEVFFAGQRREIAELAARARRDRRRVVRARASLGVARRRFLGNPVNLLLPFTAGVLGGALALYRKPRRSRPDGSREPTSEGISLRSLIATAGTLWSATATLRESLRAARFEPPTAPFPGSPPSRTSMPPPAEAGETESGTTPPAPDGVRHRAG